MTFDRVARLYQWMEYAAFGRALERSRLAFLRETIGARNVLIAGDGDGRFLCQLRRINPQARVTSVEASGRMLALARARLARTGQGEAGQVTFCQGNILDQKYAPNTFDLVVTHFFLDCFEEGELRRLVPRLAGWAAPGARWLLADFRIPEKGPMHWPARWVVGFLYLFFRLTTGLQTRTIAPPGRWIAEAGFRQRHHLLSRGGLLYSSCWEKTVPTAAAH